MVYINKAEVTGRNLRPVTFFTQSPNLVKINLLIWNRFNIFARLSN